MWLSGVALLCCYTANLSSKETSLGLFRTSHNKPKSKQIIRVLLVNDDGIHADSLHALWRALNADGHEVFVCVPDKNRAATGHGITLPNDHCDTLSTLGRNHNNGY